MTLLDLFTRPPTVLAPAFSSDQAATLSAQLGDRTGLHIYPASLALIPGALFALARQGASKRLLFLCPSSTVYRLPFSGETHSLPNSLTLTLCPTDAVNAAVLRSALPFLRPRRLGLATSVGCGDRLGLATPGHIQAVQGTGIAPILAQQSMRENARTGRTPQDVIDDAMWGVFQEGWRDGYGADADHLKTTEHIDWCVAAGYTLFTIDPGDHVIDEAHDAPAARLSAILAALPWADLETSFADLKSRYLGHSFDAGDALHLTFDEKTLARATGKYGAAIAHTARMYRHLAGLSDDFEMEVSVDETETVTSSAEHFFFANELRRLGVRWVSLAPRYVGCFEKGVDYIGNVGEFERSLAAHAAIARHLGPYKLSIHSGSDKFSIYPAFARQCADMVHLKTAGTSYLEALRAVAQLDRDLFRRILALAITRYPTDRATYHVSADLSNLPASPPPSHSAPLLDQFDARQVLHVTFGSVLAAFGDEIKALLAAHEEVHYAALAAHFQRHLQEFRVR